MSLSDECKHQVPEDFFRPLHSNVTDLNLTMSNIYHGSQAIFANFSKLKTLDISIADRFTECPADARELFELMPPTLRNLTFRRWRSNNIINKTCIVTNETLGGLQKLRNLTAIDAMFSDFMFGEKLTRPLFTGFQKLASLNIAYVRFSIIETYPFDNCPTLTCLWMDGNSLGSRPFMLFKDRKESRLKRISLIDAYIYSDYSITYDARSLLKAAPLQTIDLRRNYIVTMPVFCDETLSNGLTKINLDRNYLSDIQSGGNLADQCFCLKSLKTLTLSQNRIKNVRGLCQSITHLDLASNRLYQLWNDFNQEAISDLENLKELNIGNNQISTLSSNFTAKMKNLKYFYVAHNNLTSIDLQSFHLNIMIETLDLRANFIQSFSPTVVERLENLKKLLLEDNVITSIDQDLLPILKRSSLKDFGIVGNPLSCDCDQEFFQKWLNSTNKVRYTWKLICDKPEELKSQLIYAYKPRNFVCHWRQPIEFILSALGGVILAGLLLNYGRKYYWHITHPIVVLKAIGRYLSDVHIEETCLYDAYVMYNSVSEEDQLWVTKDLRLAIEDGTRSGNSSMVSLS
ncbi:carboxypeptidase N subunit 2-like [Watersipora subatra]|uniref:carboxypeptidase N subunit 2-like n=1 Tax=Watersipora subatra TaxID=2589382 RepID=UPI00355C0AA9